LQYLILCVAIVSTAACTLLFVRNGYAAHGLSIDGNLKYKENFQHFEYTSPQARQSGQLTLMGLGSFDKMNPFTLKGLAPLGLEALVFEPLAVSSLDEPFTKYGLIAKDISVAADKLSMTIHLDEKARFSDGTKVTAEDVLFSLKTVKSTKVHPLYADYYHDIKKGIKVDSDTVKFFFKKKNRELPLIALSIPVLSQKFYNQYSFGEEDTMVPPVGSGPYKVDKVVQGKSIVYKKNPDYWAADKNVRKHMFNFGTIAVKYYRDMTVAVEAFKAGEFDVQYVNIAKQWARDMTGEKFDSGRIHKKIFPHQNNAGMQGLVMNTRNPLFQDRRVREALNYAFNFEWTNKSLFFGQYTRSDSFFSNSYLAARGTPQGLELEYLEKYRDKLPERVFTTPPQPPVNATRSDVRKHLLKAKKLLNSAGWTVKNGVLKNDAGTPFEFEILLSSPSFNRVMAPFVKNLKKLGIIAEYRALDQALYTQRVQTFNFDMIVNVFGQSQSPGNEQKNYWHSTAAATPGSGNLAGISSPVVDDLVNKIIYASTQKELIAASRALDRVLWYGFYVIPNWHVAGHRMVYYDKLQHPDKLPKYYNYFQFLTTWWIAGQ
jgi:microcin C transport system substrate-binding protein